MCATHQICCWRVASVVYSRRKIMTATSSLKLREKWDALNYNHHQIKNINFIWMMLLLLLLEYLECVWNVWTLSNNRKLINWYFIRLKTFLTLTWSMECCVVMSEWALDLSDDRRGLNFCSFFLFVKFTTNIKREIERRRQEEKNYTRKISILSL